MTSPHAHRHSSLIWGSVVASFALSLYGIIAVADQPLVQRPDLADARASFSAVHQLAQAEVSIRRADESTPCSWSVDVDRHLCGSEKWNFVGVYNARSAGRAQRCLWVHPNPEGAVTSMRWDDVQLGATASATLMLLHGSGAGDHVHMELKIDDKVVIALQATSDRELHTKQALLSPGRDRGDVVIEVRAQDNRWRLACLRMVLEGSRPTATAPEDPATSARPSQRQRVLHVD